MHWLRNPSVYTALDCALHQLVDNLISVPCCNPSRSPLARQKLMDKYMLTTATSGVAINRLSKMQEPGGVTSSLAMLIAKIPPCSVAPQAHGQGAARTRNAGGGDATGLLVRPSPKRGQMAVGSSQNSVSKPPIDRRDARREQEQPTGIRAQSKGGVGSLGGLALCVCLRERLFV